MAFLVIPMMLGRIARNSSGHTPQSTETTNLNLMIL